ncbi:DUF2975 domain-containing protein [Clostridium saccharobutylicum]|uniref:DUF2975 domain-containing protein n=1 Tax=Clostridium saccharobutylicum DSM 13864 TaxID=1345695 RepID=U5MVT2_CLOSA|nr:DUF2975 domain-containing protein [Clostridium saccharobutylicum]AGX44653.1 hypothetical protein CLSA_c36920 [Clostridium saccharobutylicum DSM 13864]AQR91942.1 hypothetical protein CLOSC_36700 [Clostridium saccharobutylicum]AQS01844.1 hypothetical protein CSACC_36750 [Clostridium saccharobutylicum]AQS11441.1 hypothetical protein CLOBY_35970 [Clostridium saccharobutylicum]AQS15827.1 hypothetical protein CLOSACC_36750 [Clostridium saccharobutylicum]
MNAKLRESLKSINTRLSYLLKDSLKSINTKLSSLLKINDKKLNIFLEVIYYIGLIGLIGAIFVYLMFYNFVSIKPLVSMLLFSIVAYCCVLGICRELIKINSTLISKAPFVIENVKRMQKISVYLFIISAYVFTKDWLKFKAHIFAYNFDKTGLNTDAEGLIFVLVGLFVLILAKIFENAIKIKDENDLTI